MKIKKLASFILSVCICVSYFNYKVYADNNFDIDARSGILVEQSTGKILVEQNKDEQYPLASVTKIMTMILIYDAEERGQIKWDDVVTVSSHAAGMGGSQIFLEEYEQQTVSELTKSIAIAKP